MSRFPRPLTTIRRTAVPLAAAAILLAGFAQPAGAAPPVTESDSPRSQVKAPVPELDWQSCGPGLEQFECANAEVPTDYDRPAAPPPRSP